MLLLPSSLRTAWRGGPRLAALMLIMVFSVAVISVFALLILESRCQIERPIMHQPRQHRRSRGWRFFDMSIICNTWSYMACFCIVHAMNAVGSIRGTSVAFMTLVECPLAMAVLIARSVPAGDNRHGSDYGSPGVIRSTASVRSAIPTTVQQLRRHNLAPTNASGIGISNRVESRELPEQESNQDELWVIALLPKGRTDYIAVHIDARAHPTDHELFKAFQREYSKLSSRWHRLMQLRSIRNIQCVKVSRQPILIQRQHHNVLSLLLFQSSIVEGMINTVTQAHTFLMLSDFVDGSMFDS